MCNFFVKVLQQEAELSEGRTYLPLMNKHSVKHNINSLCYKKIIFFLGFCLLGENQHCRIARAFKSSLDCECITHYPGTASPCQSTNPKQVACFSKFI
jgi:hypothetical protein